MSQRHSALSVLDQHKSSNHSTVIHDLIYDLMMRQLEPHEQYEPKNKTVANVERSAHCCIKVPFAHYGVTLTGMKSPSQTPKQMKHTLYA